MYPQRQCRILEGSQSLTRTRLSAAGSALGYLYQCRVAMLWTLRRIRQGGQAEFAIVIEGLDDVVFESDGSVTELLQTKHHVSRHGDLSDASEDLWKTLRVWCDAWATGMLVGETAFYLVTTATAPTGSAAVLLGPSQGRQPEAALTLLQAVARLLEAAGTFLRTMHSQPCHTRISSRSWSRSLSWTASRPLIDLTKLSTPS